MHLSRCLQYIRVASILNSPVSPFAALNSSVGKAISPPAAADDGSSAPSSSPPSRPLLVYYWHPPRSFLSSDFRRRRYPTPGRTARLVLPRESTSKFHRSSILFKLVGLNFSYVVIRGHFAEWLYKFRSCFLNTLNSYIDEVYLLC